MGKNSESRIKLSKDGDTKVLFKKSNATTFSHSRTISGASQLYSRSGIMQLRKNLETKQHSYYTDKGKVKRDLSVETDICILRRYYRKKKNSLLGTTSGKSRYSTLVDTECETIDEYPDTSACGDNETDKSNQPLDIASLMIDNLKDLLNQWIQKHIIQNKDTKQKIDTVLDSLIQKFDTRNNLPSSSGSTYILHKEAGKQEVKNKKVATASIHCQYCKHKTRYVNVGSSAAEISMTQKKSAVVTGPFQYKDLRIISTLSIPRSFHKRGLEEKNEHNSSWYRMKKIKHRNIILSINRSNKFIDSSSFDLVAISTKSLTNKTVNNETVAKKKKRHIVFFPTPFYKSATETSSTTNQGNLRINNIGIGKDQLEAMPSLLNSLYANECNIPEKNILYGGKNINNTMTENNSNEFTTRNAEEAPEIAKDIYVKQRQTEKCLPEENESKPISANDFIERTIAFQNPKIANSELSKTSMIKIRKSNKMTTTRGKINKSKKRLAFQNIHNKQYSLLYKKANSQMSQEGDFLKHCKNIIQYFEEYKNNNIKLDVQINVYPHNECKTKDVCTDVSNQTLGIYDIRLNPTLLYNVQATKVDASVHMDEEPVKYKTEIEKLPSEFSPEIIPLFDSSICQTKLIFNVNSKEKVEPISKPNSFIERSTLTTELEIAQEISELRAVIRDLAAAAERFVNEQLKRDSNKSNAETTISRNASNYTSSSKVEAVINLRNTSKAIQYSKELIEKQKLSSGLKITKEPKKREMFDFYNKLAKKSTSYRIIDSESILRVTDMTSGANELNELPNNRDNTDIRSSRVTRFTDEMASRSLRKSKSLFAITSEHAKKRKLTSLFSDRKNPQCHLCSVHRYRTQTSWSEKSCRQLKKLFARSKKKADKKKSEEVHKTLCMCGSGTNYTSVQYVSMPCVPCNPDADQEPTCTPTENYTGDRSSTLICPEDQNEVICVCEDTERPSKRFNKCYKDRRGMGFGEGCVYCALLWIPVIVLACLFYAYVLKDTIKKTPQEKKVVGRTGLGNMKSPDNPSILYLKLSDLGF